jgi:hypothetical protein
MNKKGWNGIESLFMLAIAIILSFIFAVYSMNELKIYNAQNSSFYNSTVQGITNFGMTNNFSMIIVWVFAIAMIVWVISILVKSAGGSQID